MRKRLKAIAVIAAAFLLASCSAAAFAFPSLDSIKPSLHYERAVYSYELSNGGADDERVVYTADESYFSVTLQKVSDSPFKARLTSSIRAVYNDTREGYAGLTDTMDSVVEFYAYDGPSGSSIYNDVYMMQPVSVQKTVTLSHPSQAHQSYSYSFSYEGGESSGECEGFVFDKKTQTYVKQTKQLSISKKQIKSLFDNEELFVLAGSALSHNVKQQDNTARSFKLANIYELFNASTVYEIFGMAVGDTKSEFEGVASADGIAPMTLGIVDGNTFKGGAINAAYSLKESVTVNGSALAVRKYLLLGYAQSIRNSQGLIVSQTICTIKDYTVSQA